MNYVENTVTSSSTPTTALVTAIEAALTANTAWSFVEQVTDATFTVRVWRNSGAVNSWGTDFYIALMVTTASAGTSNLIIKASEDWNTSTKLALRGCPNPATTLVPEATYNSAYGATGYAWSSVNWNVNCKFATSTVSFLYRILVTKNGLHVFTSTTPDYGYVGLFTPWWPSATNEFPLVTAVPSTAVATRYTSVSRRPYETASMAYAFHMQYVPGTNPATPQSGTVGGTSVPLYSGAALGARITLYPTTQTNGQYRGTYMDTYSYTMATAVSLGDTITVDGSTYVCVFGGGTTLGLFLNTAAV